MNKKVQKAKGRSKNGAGKRRRILLHGVHIALHVVMWTSLLSVLGQLAYPGDRALPLATVGGRDVGGLTREEVAAQLETVAERATLTVMTPDKKREVQWATIGITIERQATAMVAVQYTWWERLVPFSMAVRMVQHNYTPIVIIDQERLSAFAKKIVMEDRQAAVGATVAIDKGQVRVDEAKTGFRFDEEDVKRRIIATKFASGATVGLQPEIVSVVRDQQAVAAVAQQARQALSRGLTLQFAGQTFTPERAMVGSWLAITENRDSKKLELRIADKELKAYLAGLNEKYASPPGTAVVTLLDGREVKRTAAETGQAMNIETAAARIERALFDTSQPPTVTVPVEAVSPEVAYERTYSRKSSGLQTIIEDWERTTYGDYGIIVREIGGQNRYAEWQPDKPFVTSSTYKMFLAYTVLSKMETGVIKGGQTTDMGWTVDACLREMIVNSTNPCAVSLQNLIGWQKVDDMLHAAGFTATNLNNLHGGDKYTTVRDEAGFLLRLHAGTLMESEGTNRLLGLMKQQIWRGGIPSGVPAGTAVANKVGFYNGWVHDVAIVYGPESTYILAIMSRGGSDPGFARLSQQVYSFFNG